MFEIYVNQKQHCLNPRWYCRFLFWMRHGEWTMKREFMTLDQLKEDKQSFSTKKGK